MTDNPRQDLEWEAREAKHEHSCSLLRMGLRPTAAIERGYHYELGYLAAATAREKEIEELRRVLDRARKAIDAYEKDEQALMDEATSLRAKVEAVPVEPVPVESIKAALKALTFAWIPDNLKHADAIDRWLATVTK